MRRRAPAGLCGHVHRAVAADHVAPCGEQEADAEAAPERPLLISTRDGWWKQGCLSVLGSWGKTMRDAVRNKER